MQKRNKASITLSLRQEIEREAQNIEKEMAKHPELDQIQVTDEMDKAFQEKIRALEKEMEERRRSAKKAEEDSRELREGVPVDTSADKPGGFRGEDAPGVSGKFRVPDDDVEFSDELAPDLSEILARGSGDGRKDAEKDAGKKVVYRRKKRKYFVVSLVAVLVIVLGVGMNSVGSKSYWKMIKEIFVGEEPVNVINIEDMEKHNTEDIDELAVYREIKEKLNIDPVRLPYKPDNMVLKNYEIYEDILTAQLLYKYQDEIIRYILYVSDVDSSWGQKEEDKKIGEYTLSINEIEIKVDEFQVEDPLEIRQTANFEYQGVHYQLSGVMEKEELKKILENLYFF